MGGSKPKVYQLPNQQQTQQTNTFGSYSIADTPEAQSLLNTPLNFGKPLNVDPGVGRRTDLAEQEAENRYNSVFNSGVPRFFREANRASELRDIRGRGAAEMQQAEYANQIGNNAMEEGKTMAELERRRLLLPQILQTGGSGTSSGFTSQLSQPTPGFFSSLAGGLGRGLGGAFPFAKIPGLG